VHLFRGLGCYWNLWFGSAPSSTAASAVVPSTGTVSGITDPSTCASVIAMYTTLVPGGYDYYCRMDLPGPTTSVGTKTDYSVGPWDFPTCAARHLMA
jgi:hypothetical protein